MTQDKWFIVTRFVSDNGHLTAHGYFDLACGHRMVVPVVERGITTGVHFRGQCPGCMEIDV